MREVDDIIKYRRFLSEGFTQEEAFRYCEGGYQNVPFDAIHQTVGRKRKPALRTIFFDIEAVLIKEVALPVLEYCKVGTFAEIFRAQLTLICHEACESTLRTLEHFTKLVNKPYALTYDFLDILIKRSILIMRMNPHRYKELTGLVDNRGKNDGLFYCNIERLYPEIGHWKDHVYRYGHKVSNSASFFVSNAKNVVRNEEAMQRTKDWWILEKERMRLFYNARS